MMGDTLHFALQEKQQSFSQDDASLSLGCQPSQIAVRVGSRQLGGDLAGKEAREDGALTLLLQRTQEQATAAVNHERQAQPQEDDQ